MISQISRIPVSLISLFLWQPVAWVMHRSTTYCAPASTADFDELEKKRARAALLLRRTSPPPLPLWLIPSRVE